MPNYLKLDNEVFPDAVIDNAQSCLREGENVGYVDEQT
jgi:hypothetical protein